MHTVLKEFQQEKIAEKKGLTTNNRILFIGYFLLAISVLIFAITEVTDERRDFLGLFFIHYGLAIVYVVYLIAKRSYGIRKSWNEEHLNKTVVLLNLFLVSAYALNREIPVFENSAMWLCVYLLLCSVTILSYPYVEKGPGWLKKIVFLLTGSALIFYLYLAVYVAPWYLAGVVGTILLGIGAHIFVPISLLVATSLLVKKCGSYLRAKTWISAGAGLTILFVVAFMTEWHRRVESMETIVNNAVLSSNDLPVWVQVAQKIDNDWITLRALKGDLVYTTVNKMNGDWGFLPGRSNWDEKRKHDPLVLMGSWVGTSKLAEEDRIRILKAISPSRHQAEDRLWSGDKLSTSFIVSDIDIYPALRIAYTEKYLSVRYNADQDSWRNRTQEAIYTFQLPEGSVVTSLSLWVNGIEEKGILTSKQKASEAYQKIVGVEQRDPSVVHWQEGNTVTVRVFPCTPDEDRKFKIGITTPLQDEGEYTLYENVIFQGPPASDARETVRVRFIGEGEFTMPGGFRKDEKGQFMSESGYDPDFSFRFKSLPVKKNQFSFNGFQYEIAPAEPVFDSLDVRRVYLDINNAWSENELAKFRKLLDKNSLYTYVENEWIKLTPDNWQVVTSDLHARNFSLFPFYKIKDPEKSLVITKGRKISPHLADIRKSDFLEKTSRYFAEGKKGNVYNLGTEKSTYIKALRELRAIHYSEGSFDQLQEYLLEKKFPYVLEDENQIFLHDAALSITRSPTSNDPRPDNAPDHLARLFAYNNIMRKTGEYYFNGDLVNEDLVHEASQAYVVSPVSSLIVLETKADYERFNIHDSKDSLQNASKKSSGAVPEPHEWALIILFLVIVVFTARRHIKFHFSL